MAQTKPRLSQLRVTADHSMENYKITNLGAPVDANDAARLTDVQIAQAGLDAKLSVRVATAAALPACTASGSGVGKTLTMNAVGILTVDGVNTVLNDRILVKNQVVGANNGIYKVTTAGTVAVAAVLTRATDADQDAEVTSGMYTFSTEGTVNDNKGWVLVTDDPIVVDTTALVFSQFSVSEAYTAGDGLQLVGQEFSAKLDGTSLIAGASGLKTNTAKNKVRQTVTAAPDGILVTFTISGGLVPASGTLEVYLNGINEHGITDNGDGTLTFDTAPLTGDDIRCSFVIA